MNSELLIGEIAKKFGLSAQAIRYYEKLGILESPPRSTTGYRLYSQATIQRLQFIQYAQSYGLSLNQIKEIIDQFKDRSNTAAITLKNMVRNHLQDLERQMERIRTNHQEISKKFEQLNHLTNKINNSQPRSNCDRLSIEEENSLLDLFKQIEANLIINEETASLTKAQKLLKLYGAGERSFQAIELIGAELNGAFLCDANFSYAEMMLASLNEVSMSKTKLHRAYLTGADLIGAYLKQAEFVGADLIGVNLTEADLTEANLTGCNLGGANLSYANFTGANLSEAVLIGTNLTGTNFKGAILLGSNFSETNYQEAIFDLEFKLIN